MATEPTVSRPGDPPAAGGPSTGDTAQSPSNGAAMTPSSAAQNPSSGANLARRRFFRQFAGEIVHGAATVVGVAGALQRSSAEAAQAILDPVSAPVRTTDMSNPAPGAPAGFRTAFRMDGERVLLVDQRRLPGELVEYPCESAAEMTYAIREMVVRGAPVLGQVAALALALTAVRAIDMTPFARRATLRGSANALVNARPTAVNVRWAVDRCLARMEAVDALNDDGRVIADAIRKEADAIVAESAGDHEALATFAFEALVIPEGRPLNLLTHCNTGPLACGQFGTALGVVQVAVHRGQPVHVYVDETRPHLQGARLTAWELAQAGVPHTLIADSAAGWLMATRDDLDAVVVGADRIAANGDTANKIGSYPLAVMAARHGIPFYVCAPLSSVDLATPDGSLIQIEQRPSSEVTNVRGAAIAPVSTPALNPAFDIVPADLITGIVTEEGLLRAPFEPALRAAVEAREARRYVGRGWSRESVPGGGAGSPPGSSREGPG